MTATLGGKMMCASVKTQPDETRWQHRADAKPGSAASMRLASWLVRPTAPPLPVGIAVCALFVVGETLIMYPLARVARADGLAVVYMIGVLAVSMVWGVRLAVVTSVASALAFNFFHATHWDWFELAVFLAVALLVSSMARLARARAVESVRRRRVADFIAGLANLALGSGDLPAVLPEASRRLARALELPYAEITLDTVAGDERRAALPLHDHVALGTLLVPADLPGHTLHCLRDKVVPALDALLSAAHDGELMSISLRTSRDELRVVAQEQAALRRVATLVARGVAPAEVFAAVATETARVLDADASRLLRYEAPGTVTVIAEFSKPGVEALLGRRLTIAGGVTEMVYRSARPARVDTYRGREGALAALARDEGLRSSVAAPVLVEGRMWGTMVVLWARDEPPPAGAEFRLAEFTELLATAVGNAEGRAELNASRARIVVAADNARRRIERDLHEGVQQRLVAVRFDLRAAEELAPGDRAELKARLSATTDGLTGVFKDLQEISRGIHPAVLAKGGLGPALKALALRCPVPVELKLGTLRRLPERVEVAAYYIVSEALTNAAKHAQASAIVVAVEAGHQVIVLSIRDNGVGGADPSRGSGLVGLTDRVAALGGQLHVVSPLGGGTSLCVELPSVGIPAPGRSGLGSGGDAMPHRR